MVRSYLVRFVVRDFGTKFWFDIIWFGTWYEILVRNSVVRFVFGLLVRDFRTGTKWFGLVRIFQKTDFSDRTDFVPNKSIRKRFGSKKKTIF